MPTDRCFALIPCGGTGSRAGAGLPKQYRTVAGQTVLAHTLTAFAAVPGLRTVLVAVSPGLSQEGPLAQLVGNMVTQAAEASDADFLLLPCAGATRAETVLNGLNALLAHGAAPADWVLVHDAARCLIQPEQVMALMAACADDPVGGLLAHKLPDTLKQEVRPVPGDEQGSGPSRVLGTLDRSDKWLAQTPQMFRVGALRQALLQAAARNQDVTDEASAMEYLGLQPRLVPGSAQNFKLTYPEDFALAEAVLRSRMT